MFESGLAPTVRLAGVTVVSFAVGVSGCSQNQTAPNDATSSTETAAEMPQVVVTSSVLCDLTEQIAQDTIELTCLMEPGQDPHTYQVKPSDRQAIENANLVLYDGYDFAPGLTGLVDASGDSATRVAVLEAAVPEPLMGEGHDHDHAEGEDHEHSDEIAATGEDPDHEHEGDDHSHDYAEGDDHAHDDEAAAAGGEHEHGEEEFADPHIWHSAENNGAIADVIATHLAKVNPDQVDFYQNNAATLMDQFAQLDTWIQAQVSTIPAGNRKLVTTHDAFRYYADAYGIEVEGALSGLSTEEQPSPGTLTSLVNQVKEAQVPAIFAETTTNPDLINTVARNASVKMAEQPLFVEGPGGAGTAAETTQAMLVVNTCTIVTALGGTCNEEDAPVYE